MRASHNVTQTHAHKAFLGTLQCSAYGEKTLVSAQIRKPLATFFQPKTLPPDMIAVLCCPDFPGKPFKMESLYSIREERRRWWA